MLDLIILFIRMHLTNKTWSSKHYLLNDEKVQKQIQLSSEVEQKKGEMSTYPIKANHLDW